MVLTTVGIDIGSTTSHCMFSRLRLQRIASFSSRFVPVEREVLHRSPILLTPYRADGSIDAGTLGAFIDRAYADAGLGHDDVDTGAVILTGNALESHSAAEIAELFAAHGGKFVRATAGHRLEAILAAHGSGAMARSRREGAVLLNVDVGGGTTKLALIDGGEVVATSAIRVGARSHDASGLDGAGRRALARELAGAIVRAACGETLRALDLLDPLPAVPLPSVVTLSGGVAEHVYGWDAADHGDLGLDLAAAIRERAAELPGILDRPGEGIRATVIGASQFSVHLSGSTFFVSDERILPLRNVPVVVSTAGDGSAHEVERRVRGAIERSGHAGAVAVALPFGSEPRYARLRDVAVGLARGAGERRPLVAALTGDVAHSVGRILEDELGVSGGIVVLDGLELSELDYIDVGGVLRPAGVVPVVVKTLVLGPV